VIENILFKISYPAEFHGQTAVEAAMALHPALGTRIDDISEIVIETQERALRIIDKTGPPMLRTATITCSTWSRCH